MHRIAIYPGTFDPITNGHLDIMCRASQLFSKVIVGVSTHPAKSPLFTAEERVELIRQAIAGEENIHVETFGGLLVDYAKSRGAHVIVRGLRAISDFEYEFQMALVNRKISNGLVTVFLMSHEKYTYLNSTIVKEVSGLGGNVKEFVPKNVLQALKNKVREK